MGTPDRKKSKHKKKESSHRSSPKHKSKKKVRYTNMRKKASRTPSRSRQREKKRDYQKKEEISQQMLSDKQLVEMFGNLQGFNLDFFKKLQDQFSKGNRPVEDNNQQTLMGLSALGFLPYINQSIPIQLPLTGSQYKKSSRMAKNMKTNFRQRLLVPLSYDSLMVVLEDPFYQEYIQDDILSLMKKRVIQLLRKRLSEQKSEDFGDKIDKLENAIKKPQIQESESVTPLGTIESILAILEDKQDNLESDVKELFYGSQMETEVEIVRDTELMDEAKHLLLQ